MFIGVSKSGSPISRWTMSFPCASRARALARTSNAVSVPRRLMRSAIWIMFCSCHYERLLRFFHLRVDQDLLAALFGERTRKLHLLGRKREQLLVRTPHARFGDDQIGLLGLILENSDGQPSFDTIDRTLLVILSPSPHHPRDITFQVDDLAGDRDILGFFLFLFLG